MSLEGESLPKESQLSLLLASQEAPVAALFLLFVSYHSSLIFFLSNLPPCFVFHPESQRKKEHCSHPASVCTSPLHLSTPSPPVHFRGLPSHSCCTAKPLPRAEVVVRGSGSCRQPDFLAGVHRDAVTP